MISRVPTRLGCALFLYATSLLNGSDLIDRVTPVAADEQVPIVDFFRPSLFSNPDLNHSGTHIAGLFPVDSPGYGVVITNLQTGKFRTVYLEQETGVRDFWWMTDEMILFTSTYKNRDTAGLYVTDRNANTYAIEQFSTCRIVGISSNRPLYPIVWIAENSRQKRSDSGVVRINTIKSYNRKLEEYRAPGFFSGGNRSGSFRLVSGIDEFVTSEYSKPKGVARGYISDRDGELAFAITSFDGDSHLFRYFKRDWIECPVELDPISVIGPGDRPGELIVLGPQSEGERRGIFRLDSETGELGELIYRDPKYDSTDVELFRHPKTRDLLGVSIRALGTKTVWFDEKMEEVQNLLDSNLQGQMVSIVDTDDRQNHFLFATNSDRQPIVYHRLDVEKKWLGLVKKSAPWIDPDRTCPVQAVEFKTRDDKTLEGFLCLPAGASKENPVPIVVLLHEGPWTNDSWGWDPEVQFLASRGYAVFQPNYRGSTGYDWMFDRADLVDFRKMHEDVTDGVHEVILSGLIDRDRIAIAGSQFGGYLALCGAVFEPDLYKCAVSMAGILDWERMLNEMRQDDDSEARFRGLMPTDGDSKEAQETFDRNSPVHHTGSIEIPIFVSLAAENAVVSIEQSKKLISELKSNNVEHVVHFERREARGTADLKNRLELYSAIETFLAENL